MVRALDLKAQENIKMMPLDRAKTGWNAMEEVIESKKTAWKL